MGQVKATNLGTGGRISDEPACIADVIVLGMGTTGLACARQLARRGLRVLGATLTEGEVGRSTRCCPVADLTQVADDSDRLCQWLLSTAQAQEQPPVVLPTSDKLALMLAQNQDLLAQACSASKVSYDQLLTLVSKDQLYLRAKAAGLDVPPTLDNPTGMECREWSKIHAGPYLLKPYYQGCDDSRLGKEEKNRTIASCEELIEMVDRTRTEGGRFIVQQILEGNDGWIFDCYGLCDVEGRVRVMASHQRIRQYLPDYGITCYGEIPAKQPGISEEDLFERTSALMGELFYHGIFGIEWLLERTSGRLYLLDFNARPFYTIGHLGDCGLNLPWLAYRELRGDDLADVPLRPRLRAKKWLDFWAHAGTFSRERQRGRMSWVNWLSEILSCRSFAIWSLRDPGPAYRQFMQKLTYFLDQIQRNNAP